MNDQTQIPTLISKEALIHLLICINAELMNRQEVLLQMKKVILKKIQKVIEMEEKCQIVQKRLCEVVLRKQMAKEKRQNTNATSSCSTNEQDNVNIQNSIEKLFLKNTYKYTLKIVNNLESPLLTKKNFSLNLQLQDHKGQIPDHSNNQVIQLLVYSSNKQPEIIQYNNKGQRLLTGNSFTLLIKGQASFKKIRFTDTSSKYPDGVFHIVLSPKRHIFDKQNQIQSDLIRPLILKNLEVKATS